MEVLLTIIGISLMWGTNASCSPFGLAFFLQLDVLVHIAGCILSIYFIFVKAPPKQEAAIQSIQTID